MREEIIGSARLILGDCREIVPSLERPAALISDPPYGQRQNTNVTSGKGGREYRCGPQGGGSRIVDGNAKRKAGGGLHTTGWATQWPEGILGDDEPFDPAPWLSAADRVLLWGAHKFADRLPAGSWLVWDKVPTGKVRDQGDGEAAWINDNPPRPLRIHRLLWDGVCVGSAARQEVTAGQSRVHPTQKPVSLMQWCIGQAHIPAGGVILDPYAGSGSTGVAALQMGFRFVGIEAVPAYFETMLRRIEAAQRQTDMFVSALTPPPVTPDMFAVPA